MTEKELKLLNYDKGCNNYILKGNAMNHWCAFGISILNKLKEKFGDSFNIVVYWMENDNQISFVNIPYCDIKHLFTPEHMTPSQNRWDFIIKQGMMCVHANINFAIDIKPYFNRVFASISPNNQDKIYYEGSPKLRLHLSKERNTQLIQQFKQERMRKDPGLHCEICEFSFYERYGDIGYKYTEAHHIKPISQLTVESETTFSDLIIVCSNCHSMLHTANPPLSPNDLKSHLKDNVLCSDNSKYE